MFLRVKIRSYNELYDVFVKRPVKNISVFFELSILVMFTEKFLCVTPCKPGLFHSVPPCLPECLVFVCVFFGFALKMFYP